MAITYFNATVAPPICQIDFVWRSVGTDDRYFDYGMPIRSMIMTFILKCLPFSKTPRDREVTHQILREMSQPQHLSPNYGR